MSDVTLENIKPGDTVLYSYGSHWTGAAKKAVKVDRVTASQIICGAQRFYRKNGYQVGGGRYNAPKIEPASEEKLNAIRMDQERAHMINNRITRDALKPLSHDALKRICDIIDSHNQPAPKEPQHEKVPD